MRMKKKFTLKVGNLRRSVVIHFFVYDLLSAPKTGGSVTATLTHDGKLNTAISLEEKSKIIQILLDSMGINYTLPAVQNEADTEPDLQILPGVTTPAAPAAPADLCVQGRDPWYAASCEEELPFVCEY